MSKDKTLRVVSLEPKVILMKKEDSEQPLASTEEVIIAPFLLDESKVIDDIGELIDVVHQRFSEACAEKNLEWEAELELGMEFGVKFSVKLKITPKS
jgi:hypothetical protein